VFVATLVARLPVAWLKPLLPATVGCAELAGSIWSGSCAGLVVGGSPIGDTEWTLRAAPLLRAHLAGTLTIDRVGGHLDGAFELAPGGALTLRDLHARLALDRPFYRNLLPRFAAGNLRADLPQLDLAGRRLRALRGRIEARGLVQPGGPPTPLGSYELRFDSPPQPNGDLVGVVHDLDGPIAFDGSLRLTDAPGFRLEGRVAARAGADPGLERVLRFLGPADASGRRLLTEEGTF
jgi:hypothetical protein